MCLMELEECGCICHTGATVAHMMACCVLCPDCGKRIKPYGIDRHLAEHERKEREVYALADELFPNSLDTE